MILLAAVSVMASSCAVSRKSVVPPAQVRPALEATAEELIERYNKQARVVQSLNAGVELNPVAGSTYTGVIEDYRDVRGFILAQRPANIRVIGQAPLIGKNIFDMVSDGETFRIYIPSKNKFLVGAAKLERPAKKPIENIRPQHLLDAMFLAELPPGKTVLIEEFDSPPDRFYILTLLREANGMEIERKVWFDRSDLHIARVQIFGERGRLVADIRYAEWQAVAGSAGEGNRDGENIFPRRIWLVRSHDDYQLEMRITKLTLNEAIAADRFHLEQPEGTELVRVGEGSAEARQ